MSEACLPFKRRRVQGAVQKPFKSPMRTPLKAAPNPPVRTPLVSQSPLQKYSTIASDQGPDVENQSLDQANLVWTRKAQYTPSGVRSIGHPTRSQTCWGSQNNQLQAVRELENKVRFTQRENEQLRQAVTILDSSKDEELENLVYKWRSAARLAAEEVYGIARDKVNRMGGVEGLRDQERQTKELRQQWEAEDREYQMAKRIKELSDMVEEGEATAEDLERFVAQTKDEPERQYVDIDNSEEPTKKVKDEDGYSMGMMLKNMSIDFDVIGYCTHRQCWT